EGENIILLSRVVSDLLLIESFSINKHTYLPLNKIFITKNPVTYKKNLNDNRKSYILDHNHYYKFLKYHNYLVRQSDNDTQEILNQKKDLYFKLISTYTFPTYELKLYRITFSR